MKKFASYLAATLIFNTAIAGVLTLLLRDISFLHKLIFSQCIGLSILLVNLAIFAKMPSGIARLAVLGLSVPISVAFGVTLGFAFTGLGSWSDPRAWHPMVIGLFFGFIGAIVFLLSERLEAEVKQRQLLTSESARREIEAHLKLLQAQIEPHFLFNTLANVGSLIDADPALAKRLLEHLNGWLRVALARARSDNATLGDELEMLENYLNIMQIRFGARLRWRIEAPENARRRPFPPMLLQPLVENAVRHGIEPKLGGGEIGIRAGLADGKLRIAVDDDGAGLRSDAAGTGLANVRARLASLFGDGAKLTLEANPQGGTSAAIELPALEAAL